MSRNYDDLSQLNLLENVVRQSLVPDEAPLATTPTPKSEVPRFEPIAPSPAPIVFQTNTDEYRPALQDASIIEALLRFQKSIKRSSSPHAHGIEFAPPSIPRIETEVKSGLKPSSIHRPKRSH